MASDSDCQCALRAAARSPSDASSSAISARRALSDPPFTDVDIERHRIDLDAQPVGDIAFCDAVREPFHDCRLANAGLADQHRVVLGSPRQHTDDAPDLVVAVETAAAKVMRPDHLGTATGRSTAGPWRLYRVGNDVVRLQRH